MWSDSSDILVRPCWHPRHDDKDSFVTCFVPGYADKRLDWHQAKPFSPDNFRRIILALCELQTYHTAKRFSVFDVVLLTWITAFGLGKGWHLCRWCRRQDTRCPLIAVNSREIYLHCSCVGTILCYGVLRHLHSLPMFSKLGCNTCVKIACVILSNSFTISCIYKSCFNLTSLHLKGLQSSS